MKSVTRSVYPTLAEWRSFIRLCLEFFVLFYLIYGATSLWGSWIGATEVPKLWLDQQLPFVESSVWFYLSISLLMFCSPLVLDTRELGQLADALRFNLYGAALVFILLPTNVSVNPEVQQATSQGIFLQLADLMNLKNNAFPSLHVAFAVTLAGYFCPRLGKTGQAVVITWVCLIVTSTVLLQQHRCWDVLGGIALSAAVLIISDTASSTVIASEARQSH